MEQEVRIRDKEQEECKKGKVAQSCNLPFSFDALLACIALAYSLLITGEGWGEGLLPSEATAFWWRTLWFLGSDGEPDSAATIDRQAVVSLNVQPRE